MDVVKKISESGCNTLELLRSQEKTCDTLIKVKDGEIPCHRILLMACSPFFQAFFKDDNCNFKEVELPDHDMNSMLGIVQFAYTRTTSINCENVQDLLIAADFFNALGLIEASCNFIKSNIDDENVLGVLRFARYYQFESLNNSAAVYVVSRFAEISQTQEFIELTYEELRSILADDRLNVNKEELIFESMIRWVEYNSNTRKSLIAGLLSCIRLCLLDEDYFMQHVRAHPFIGDVEACRQMIIDTTRRIYSLQVDAPPEEHFRAAQSMPRIPSTVAFVVGGWSGGAPTNAVETYDPRAKSWVNSEVTLPSPRAYHGCATLYSKVYMIGGFDGFEYFNSCFVYDPTTLRWREIAPMHCKRCYVSVAVIDGKIYAMGGFDGHNRQTSAECYTPEDNQWRQLPPMQARRSDASASAMDGKVYICGGFDGHECLNTVETYDPITDSWISLPPMINNRSGVGVIVLNTRLYAIGGFNGFARLQNAEMWNPASNTWTLTHDMNSPRSNFALEVLDDKIIVMGGFNGMTTISDTEMYEPTLNRWTRARNMSINRSALSACLLTVDLGKIDKYRRYIDNSRFMPVPVTTRQLIKLPEDRQPEQDLEMDIN